MLLDGRNTRGLVMEFPIVAENDPLFRPNDIEPFIVLDILREVIFLAVMPFNIKGRPRSPKCLWKALPETTVEVKG